jgi:LysM repeat protein
VKRFLVAFALLTAACSPIAAGVTPTTPLLHPYSTATAAPTSDRIAGAVISAETPLPSPTPSSYTIKAGDTLSQIAERLRVSVDVLLLANPGLDPNALRVGATLTVPGGAGSASFSTPTPVPVGILDVDCRPMATGAYWCFALIHNDSTEMLENVTGIISIVDSSGLVLASQDVALLLDVLPPSASLPLAVSFSGPLPLDIRPQARILTAMRISTDTPRYLPALAHNTLTQVSWSGRTADVSGELMLPAGVANAAQAWIAALAYDGSGRLVGWRRWENPGGLAAGTSTRFQTSVYSLAGAIERVDLVVQARP